MIGYKFSESILFEFRSVFIYLLAVPGHAVEMEKKKKKERKYMFLICLIFQYLDNEYIKTLLNSNGIKLEIIS